MSIHPTAIVDSSAEIRPDVEIGPYAVIGAGVTIGARTRVGPHACLLGPLEVGEDNVIAFSAAIGHDPQIAGSNGPFGSTRIGNRNVFREFSQVHRSREEDGVTVIGDDNYLMGNAHVAHDCVLGNRITLCNNVMLAGHVTVGDRAFFGGGAGVHQFSRIGALVMIGGNSSIDRDIAPYAMVSDRREEMVGGVNVIGMRRADIPAASRRAVKAAFRVLFRSGDPLEQRLGDVVEGTPEVAHLLEFLRTTTRGVVGFGGRGAEERGPSRRDAEDAEPRGELD